MTAWAIAVGTALASVVGAGEVTKLHTYYFGNSLTGNTMPTFHPELGKSAGKDWTMARSQGAGWQVWQHLYTDVAKPHRDAIAKGGWDAIVIQPFGGRLFNEVVTEMWGEKFDAPRNVGDLHCCAELIKLLLKGNPEGRALIYSDWCGIDMAAMGFDRKDAKLQELSGDLKYAAQWHEVMEPYRRKFDFESAWLAPYDESVRPTWNLNASSRDHDYRLMEELKKHFPELWLGNRLNLIPAGDVWLALDGKMRKGEVPGLLSIGDYYTNGVHIRSGLPRYTAAATFYAVLFRDHPRNLDWRVYNDPSKYLNTHGWICSEKDLGVHLAITEERAKIVNDTIWEVVTSDPYAGVSA